MELKEWEDIEYLHVLAFRNLNNFEKLEVERLKNKINEIIMKVNELNAILKRGENNEK